MKTILFKNNDAFQSVGLGTWKATGDLVISTVKNAIDIGYRHIDTAAIYQNENEIGQALTDAFKNNILKREELFITSKLWNDAHESSNVILALKESLNKLQLDYLDLFLIHWPVAIKQGVIFPSEVSEYISLEKLPIIETWKQLEKAKNEGLVKHIGVSNFSVKKLKDLVTKSNIKPEVNQVEMHPLLQQNELLNYCKEEDIIITGYSPLGSGDRSSEMKAKNEPNLMELKKIKNIALKHGASTAQILIAWQLNRGTSVIPKSTSKDHLIDNFNAGSIILDEGDMQEIKTLDKNFRFINGKFFEMPGSGYSNIYDE